MIYVPQNDDCKPLYINLPKIQTRVFLYIFRFHGNLLYISIIYMENTLFLCIFLLTQYILIIFYIFFMICRNYFCLFFNKHKYFLIICSCNCKKRMLYCFWVVFQKKQTETIPKQNYFFI